jgi:hypothetical protein
VGRRAGRRRHSVTECKRAAGGNRAGGEGFSYWDRMPITPESFAPFLFGIGLGEVTGSGAMLYTAFR